MKIPVDPDLLDWDKIKKDAMQSMLEQGKIKSIEEGEKLNWKKMIADCYARREKEYIEYTRHQELLTAIGACANVTPLWK